jgi:hypothetical protein
VIAVTWGEEAKRPVPAGLWIAARARRGKAISFECGRRPVSWLAQRFYTPSEGSACADEVRSLRLPLLSYTTLCSLEQDFSCPCDRFGVGSVCCPCNFRLFLRSHGYLHACGLAFTRLLGWPTTFGHSVLSIPIKNLSSSPRNSIDGRIIMGIINVSSWEL